MKLKAVVLSLLAVFFVVTGALAVNKADITKNVDAIVTAIESGKDAAGYKADEFDPYAFIMKEDGTMVVHPSLSGEINHD